MILIEFRENDYLSSKQVLWQAELQAQRVLPSSDHDSYSDFLNGSNFDSRSIQSKNALTRWVEHSTRNRMLPKSRACPQGCKSLSDEHFARMHRREEMHCQKNVTAASLCRGLNPALGLARTASRWLRAVSMRGRCENSCGKFPILWHSVCYMM